MTFAFFTAGTHWVDIFVELSRMEHLKAPAASCLKGNLDETWGNPGFEKYQAAQI